MILVIIEIIQCMHTYSWIKQYCKYVFLLYMLTSWVLYESVFQVLFQANYFNYIRNECFLDQHEASSVIEIADILTLRFEECQP